MTALPLPWYKWLKPDSPTPTLLVAPDSCPRDPATSGAISAPGAWVSTLLPSPRPDVSHAVHISHSWKTSHRQKPGSEVSACGGGSSKSLLLSPATGVQGSEGGQNRPCPHPSAPGLPAPSPALLTTTTLWAQFYATLLTARGWHCCEQAQNDQAEG